jgi:alpha-tubulin suppressor-like RCC1 family protein
MSINIESLKSQLAAKIASIDGSTDANELLLLSASLNNLTEDRVVTVATPDDLPVLQIGLSTFPFPSGTIFYVESLLVLVISSKARWIGFDGRVLRSDAIGAITYAWGYNNYGQLGDGNQYTGQSSPVTVLGGITRWSQLSAGYRHSLGVANAGIAYAWGYNGNGQLGDGTTTSRLSPVTVIGGITNWRQLSAGYRHSLGVTDAGIAYAWGYNTAGQLGDGGLYYDTPSPVTVIGGITNWSQLSAGSRHSLGLTSDGIAYAWGYNNAGQLGDGTTDHKSSPVTVLGGITNWSQLSAGYRHSLGVTDAGIAYAWGYNTYGQLGDGTTDHKSSPVTVVGGITNWSQLSGGRNHSLGLTSTGIAYAWGFNDRGQLGDEGLYSDTSSPVTVVGGITNWSQVSAGRYLSLGLTNTGIAYAWGYNGNGQLGDGTSTDTSSPVTVLGGITNWSQLSAGYIHSLGLKILE